MSEFKMYRLSQAARQLNVGTSTIVEFLDRKGFDIDNKPNTKISEEQFEMLQREFQESQFEKEEASSLEIGVKRKENIVLKSEPEEVKKKNEDDEIMIKNVGSAAEPANELTTQKLQGIKVVGKIDLDAGKKKAKEVEEKPKEPIKKVEKEVEEKPKEPIKKVEKEVEEKPKEATKKVEKEVEKAIEGKADQLKGLTVVGKIELPKERKPVKKDKKDREDDKKKRKRVRISHPVKEAGDARGGRRGKKDTKRTGKEPVSDKDIQEKIKATLAKLGGSSGGGKSRAKYRKDKRSANAEKEQLNKDTEDSTVLKLTEFISANDLASLLNVNVNDIISTCMSLGLFVSINQRLDAETITVIADEFGHTVEFLSADEDQVEIEEVVEEDPKLLIERAPIVTIMGHVDHGKTTLLDYIKNTNIADKEAGGITQHIGAYNVTTESGKPITFLDTPGHEAFTAMRARGAKLTDIVIIVIAADDGVMPQTKEAINHAQLAGVPIIIAINKVDKPGANSDKIKEELANINVLVEDWGGKYQCQELSAKKGTGVDDLLVKVLLEAEVMELKANPNRNAIGTVVEAELDKGRGYITTLLVQSGTLKIGDVLIAGSHFGKVKAMFDHLGGQVKEAGPSLPVLVLGLGGAPQSGDKVNVLETEQEAREVATKRQQIQREQNFRTKKHITLDEIGRRLAIGGFKELNIIVKGDVDGSVEALSDSLLKLSTEEIKVSIIQKGVGQITESDVLLATASDAIIVGFQVRPSDGARKLAENEQIEIRTYSVIYKAIEEVTDAMEGMLDPEVVEVITGNAEVREVFKITKIGTVAGSFMIDGIIKRNNDVRLIRDGVVTYTGQIKALKRFKEDVGEVKSGFECGISIKDFNDIKVGDVIEGFEEKETKRTL